jgi:putative membrane protein
VQCRRPCARVQGVGLPKHPHRAINFQHRRFVLWLAGIFGALTLALGIAPWHRQDWLLENVMVLAALAVLCAIYRHMPFSRLSWSLVFAFLCLHELGAHYTYSEVPYDAWCEAVTGRTLHSLVGWERNNFDRIIHLCYGLLLAYPIRELFFHLARARGFWSYFLPLDLTLSSSAFYEMIEWAAARVFGGELGVAYVGTQGDPWDAQKDMALAAIGALAAMLATALVNWRCQRDFTREWTESLRIHPPP